VRSVTTMLRCVGTWRNWAGTVRGTPSHVATPASVPELQAVVRDAPGRVKPVGAGHSFTAVAATDGTQLRLDLLSGIESVDSVAHTATVLAGTTLRDLNESLWGHGLALSNLGDIDAQTVGGALATGTHGTGARFGGLAAQVLALDLVTADGELLHCPAGSDLLAAARVGLGALGVVARVTLQCEPAFELRAVERPAPLDDTLAGFDDTVAAHDHVEFYWFPHTRRVLTKCNDRLPADAARRPLPRLRGWLDDEFLSNTVFEGANRLATRVPAVIPRLNRVSARALSAREYTDRSYRVFCSPRRVVFRELEYAIPRAALAGALRDVDRAVERSGERVAFPVEVRVAAADDGWLSTAYGRDSAYIAVHQYHRRPHERYFRTVEDVLRAAGGRPHWGKLHTRRAADLRPAYPCFDAFVEVRDRLDPGRRFGNPYLEEVLGS
jgi:FAD-linked oxidoreductase